MCLVLLLGGRITEYGAFRRTGVFLMAPVTLDRYRVD